MTKATQLVECRRLVEAVEALGGTVPPALTALLASYAVLAAPQPTDNAGEREILSSALAGTLDEKTLAKMLPAAASAQAVDAYRKDLAGRAETIVLGAFHRAIDDGAADEILTSLRGSFDKAAKGIAVAKSLFTSEASPDFVLASGERGTIEAWQQLGGHIGIITKIAAVASSFGATPLASFPQIRLYAGASETIDDRALMVTTGSLLRDSAAFGRPDAGHRSSPFFRTELRLHTIAEARRRHDDWAAAEFDRIHAGPRGGRLIDGRVVEDQVPVNPYRVDA